MAPTPENIHAYATLHPIAASTIAVAAISASPPSKQLHKYRMAYMCVCYVYLLGHACLSYTYVDAHRHTLQPSQARPSSGAYCSPLLLYSNARKSFFSFASLNRTDDTTSDTQGQAVPLACGRRLPVRAPSHNFSCRMQTESCRSWFIGSKSSDLTWLATTPPLPPQAVAVLRSVRLVRQFPRNLYWPSVLQVETHRLPFGDPISLLDLDITAVGEGTRSRPS